ncbi:hypothetical protein E4T43_02016 [Aureobasidium subglaciale]|nr:hypothetical protein E4T43_02016 [Aureobasidium subglaciale]
MDLPKELRILIYEHALRQDEPLDATEGWPALARVSRQLQQEATDVIVRVNYIQLSINHSTCPSESKECSKLEHIDSRHTDWLKSIGSEAVAKLRRILFAYGCDRTLEIDLSCTDASQWIQKGMLTSSDDSATTLAEALQYKKERLPLYPVTRSFIIFYFTDYFERNIREAEEQISNAQTALGRFSSQCGRGHFVKSTVQSLEILAGAVHVIKPESLMPQVTRNLTIIQVSQRV